MLRRKLLVILGPLVALLLVMAVAAILLLQGVLSDLEHINTQAWKAEEHASQLSEHIGQIEVELYELQLGRQHRLDPLIDTVESARTLVNQLGESYVVRNESPGGAGNHYARLRETWPVFQTHVSTLATVPDQAVARAHSDAALSLALSLRQDILPLSRAIHAHAHEEQEALVRWMRWLVLGLAIVFLLVINAAVLLLLRVGAMVLSPIDKLVKASRELAAERFDYRVSVDQNDEFDELARAYNQLAGALQANERRRLETLGHVATTLNHELNNAMAMIELQLQLLARRAAEGLGEPMEKCLRRIHEGLERMAKTVEALKHIKRIVLTDYAQGMKMLDLRRSTEEEEGGAPCRDAGGPAGGEAGAGDLGATEPAVGLPPGLLPPGGSAPEAAADLGTSPGAVPGTKPDPAEDGPRGLPSARETGDSIVLPAAPVDRAAPGQDARSAEGRVPVP